MVSQFVSSENVRLLSDLDFDFPEGTHAIGRLDNTSEGLLLLTTNKNVTRLLFEDTVPHSRTYLIQVENQMTEAALQLLQTGVTIGLKDGGTFTTSPCAAVLVKRPHHLLPAKHEFGAHLSHSWLELTLTEGKFHQVRKMVAAIGHPCKRLVRVAIEQLQLGDLQPGEVQEMAENRFFEGLRINP